LATERKISHKAWAVTPIAAVARKGFLVSYEIRAMSLGEVLDTAFRLVTDHFTLLVGIALAVALPMALVGDLAAEMAAGGGLGAAAGLLGLGLFVMIVSPIISAAITHAISEVYLGRPAGFAPSLRLGASLLLRLVGTSILMVLLVFLGTLLLILPGIYLLFAFMLTYQVVVIEDLAGWSALKRSHDLSRGHLLRVFGVYLVAMVLMAVVGTGINLVGAQVPYLGTLLNAVSQAVFTAYMAAAYVVLYFDIRCRKEAFDLDHLAELVSEEAIPTAVSG
jgi:hypothetical protein